MELDHFLQQTIVVLGAAVVVLLLCHRLRVPPIAGLLLTGLVIGPSGTGLADDDNAIHILAEIGVVLLLFTIGLELSLEKLKRARRSFFFGGGAQALLTTAVAVAVATLFGVGLSSAIFYGFVLTLSSTAIVLKLYGDRRQSDSPQGRLALAILLFQDFLIVPMIVITPVLGGAVAASPSELAVRFGGTLFAVVLIFIVARYLMPGILRHFVQTRIREVFVLGALGLCLAMAWLTHSLGFSLALGAFVAGIIISETEYSYQVVADIAPFRDVFASVFFVSVGMLVDLRYAASHALVVLALAAAIIVTKAIICGIAVALLRFPARTVASVALALAQIGEFSFVLMEVGRVHGLLQGERYQLVLSAAVITMLATPGLLRLGPQVATLWYRIYKRSPAEEDSSRALGLKDHVVIVGFGLGGSLLARVLRDVNIPYVVIELNGEAVRRARGAGEPMIYGDASRREILEHAGVERAKVIVFAIHDLASLELCVPLARQLNSSLQIIVRTRMLSDLEDLERRGADQVVAEEFETAIEIFTRVLNRFHVPRNVVRAQTRLLRGESYRMLRAPSLAEGVSDAVLEALVAGTTDIYRVDPTSVAVSKTLRELDLRHQTGASVIALVRGETSHSNPSAEFVIESGDDLVLVGSHQEVDRAFAHLDGKKLADLGAM